jgi:DNA-binding Lrp family transcriptional regulator
MAAAELDRIDREILRLIMQDSSRSSPRSRRRSG